MLLPALLAAGAYVLLRSRAGLSGLGHGPRHHAGFHHGPRRYHGRGPYYLPSAPCFMTTTGSWVRYDPLGYLVPCIPARVPALAVVL